MKKILSIILSVTLVSFTANAGDFVLNEYNVVTIEDFTLNGHVDGNSFVGGELSGNNIVLGARSSSDAVVLTVAGELNTKVDIQTKKITVSTDNSVKYKDNGNKVEVNGNQINNLTDINNFTASDTSTLDAIRVDYEEQLVSASKAFGSLQENSDLVLGNNIVDFNINNELVKGDYAVFSIDGSSIFDGGANGGVGMFTSVAGKTDAEVLDSLAGIIINVSGDNLVLGREMNDNNFNSSLFTGKVIWNFTEATTITINKTFSGTLLAPFADVTVNSTNIDGAVGVKSLDLLGEIHTSATNVITPDTPPTTVKVPEPMPLFLITIAMVGLLLKRRALKI